MAKRNKKHPIIVYEKKEEANFVFSLNVSIVLQKSRVDSAAMATNKRKLSNETKTVLRSVGATQRDRVLHERTLYVAL